MSFNIHPLMTFIGQLFGSLILICAMISGSGALWYHLPFAGVGKLVIILIYISVGGFSYWQLWLGTEWQALKIFGIVFICILGWWSTIKPSNQRVWADDTSKIMQAHVEGNKVTLTNIRNFNWQSDTQYDARWETRQYDLDQRVSTDLIL